MQPTRYVPNADYSVDIVPGDEGNALDADFDDLQLTTDEICDNLELLQRDDGGLKNGIVTPDSLSASAAAMLGDWTPRGAWVTATAYSQLDFVTESGIGYLCLVDHVAGTFATDLAAGKWTAISKVDSLASAFTLTLLDEVSQAAWRTALDVASNAEIAAAIAAHTSDASAAHAATAISFTPAAGIAATTVQAAIEEAVTDGTAALAAHTGDAADAHDASAISFAGNVNLAATDVEAAIDELAADRIKAIHVNTTGVGNVGAGTDALMAYNVPANTLNVNGKTVRVKAWGKTANNSSTKEIGINFGGGGLSFSLTINLLGVWEIDALFIRTGSNAQDYLIKCSEFGSGAMNANLKQGGAAGTMARTDTNAIALEFFGTATSNNDITQEGLIVEVLQQ